MTNDQNDIRLEIDRAISELEQQGITTVNDPNRVGLGDVVESVLSKLGITEEKFKSWFALHECNCSKRKAWLNNVFSWKK